MRTRPPRRHTVPPALFAALAVAAGGCSFAVDVPALVQDTATDGDGGAEDAPNDVDDDGPGDAQMTCGNGVREPPEECDDGNDVPGDGCEADCRYSCSRPSDCWEQPVDDPCTLDLCEAVAAGRACSRAVSAGTPCDDGRFCTRTDVCDAAGACASTGSPCPAGDICNEATDRCDPPGSGCVIGSSSYPAGTVNPGNACEWCRPEVSGGDWTARPDFTACTLRTTPDYSYDICVRGTCISPGSCGTAACNPPGPSFSLPDTAQRACYDAAGALACPGAVGWSACGSTPFCGQDAQYGWDTAHAPGERFARTGTEPTVTDLVTGLVWQGCSAGQTGPTCSGTPDLHTWVAALEYCEALTWGEAADWGLPDRFELQSIIDFGRSAAPCIEATAFPGTSTDPYWTSSSYASATEVAGWYVLFAAGTVNFESKADRNAVRCVRRPELGGASGARYLRSEPTAGQPVVTDSRTGLLWQGCPAGLSGTLCTDGSPATMGWQAALAWCQTLDWGGRSDWRLPDVVELSATVDDTRASLSVNPDVFPGTPSGYFWSSSTYAGPASPLPWTPADAWAISAFHGNATTRPKTTGVGVRCVAPG